MLTINPSQQQTNNEDTSRVFWIVVTLLSALYLAAIFLLGPFSAVWRGAQPYAELVVQYPSLIRFSTCLLGAGCAWFLFWPRQGSRFVGRWSDCVSLAFATFALQYGLRFTELKLEGILNPTVHSAFHHATSFVVYICSALNNLLFLAAARILLNKNKVRQVYSLEDDPRIFFQFRKKLRNAWADFQGAVPKWAFIAAMLGPLALLDSWPRLFWARFPDAIFSVWCLWWFGYATAVNLNEKRRTLLAATAMLIALTYGGAQLVYATNPLITYSVGANRSQSASVRWIRANLGLKADSLAGQTNKRTGRSDSTIIFLDNAVYAGLLPLKLALFLPAFSLFLLYIVSSLNDIRPALLDSIRRRKDYLSSDGIVGAIGSAIGAKKVSLYIRIPGTQELGNGREERALRLVWNSNGYCEKPEPISITSHPQLRRIMKEGGEILDSDEVPETTRIGRTIDEHPWLVPITFHGGVIGVLRADVTGHRRNHTALQKVRLMKDLIAPSVQDYRSLAAMDQMGFRFTRLQVDHPNETFFEATRRMAIVMHDILSPLASALIIEIGFTSIHHFCAENDGDKQLLKDQENDSWLEDEETREIGEDQSIRLEKSKTLVKSRQHRNGREPVQIGGLMFTIPKEKDQFALPTLAAYYLNRKTVASIVADGIFDVARVSFSEIIKDMALEFSIEPLSDPAWFATVQTAVERSGIRWAVAQRFTNGLSGDGGDRIKLHPNLSPDERATLLAQPLVTPDAESFQTPRIMEILLRKSNYRLWLGIERENFGTELDFDSPWRIFLESLADVSDAALDSLQKKREAELAREDQEVIAIAVMTGTLTHQLFNLLGDQVQATEVMDDEVSHDPSIKLTNTYKKQFQNLRTSALNGRDLTEAFSRITKGDTSRLCTIKQAAEEAYMLHRTLLRRRQIDVIYDPSTEQFKVPFFRAAFALANLVGNASDAIRIKGKIDIEAEETNEFIVCHVTNDGLAIRENMRERLFEFGATDKPDHKGWGLYYVRRLLAQIDGKVELTHSYDKNTRFTISFPKNFAQE